MSASQVKPWPRCGQKKNSRNAIAVTLLTVHDTENQSQDKYEQSTSQKEPEAACFCQHTHHSHCVLKVKRRQCWFCLPVNITQHITTITAENPRESVNIHCSTPYNCHRKEPSWWLHLTTSVNMHSQHLTTVTIKNPRGDCISPHLLTHIAQHLTTVTIRTRVVNAAVNAHCSTSYNCQPPQKQQHTHTKTHTWWLHLTHIAQRLTTVTIKNPH